MNREQKRELADSLRGVFDRTAAVVVAQYRGLTVGEMFDLRRQMRATGARLKVTKNRIAKLALKGTRFEQLGPLFKGPTAIAYADDPVSAAKAAAAYAKQNDKFVLLGGAMGTTLFDAAGVKTLATLPSLDELRGKIVGLLLAPATKVAGVMQAPAATLARVVSAFASKSTSGAAS